MREEVSSWVGGRRRGWWALRCRGESQLLRLKKQTNRVTDRQSDTDHARLLVFFWSPCGPKDDWISVEAALPCRSCGTVTNWSSPMCGDKLPRATNVRAWIKKTSEAFRTAEDGLLTQFLSLKFFFLRKKKRYFADQPRNQQLVLAESYHTW